MWSVVIGAVAARRGQALVIALMSLLACGAAAAAGWYAAAAAPAVAVATAQAAPLEQRLVTATRTAPGPAVDETPARLFGPVTFQVVSGGHVAADLRMPSDQPAAQPVRLAHRDDVCAHLSVTGRCPATPGEVLVPAELAARLGLSAGHHLRLVTATTQREPVRVVGTYRIVDPFDAYWGDRQLLDATDGQPAPEVVFALAETVGDDGLRSGVSTHDLVVDPEVFATVDHETVSSSVQDGVAELSRQGYAVSTQLPALVDRVAAEAREVRTGVAVGVAQLLMLTMFALAVVFAAAADRTRRDTAWWQLRGALTGHHWTATLAPTALPLLVGAALGTAVGAAVGYGVVGGASGTASTAWRLTAILVGITVVAAALAAVGAQLGTLRTPVRELLRRVPVRRRWRRQVVDLVVLTLVAAATTQAVLAGEAVTGIGLLAPGLVGLGLAVLAGWALAPMAARLAGRALRAGRLPVALASLSIARRPGGQRLFALAAAAVALLTVALVGADTVARSQWQRATVQTGAAQVLTVSSTDAGQLLAAVRAADPDGREAMAVVHTPARGAGPPVLALDTTRLAHVAGWHDGYGGAATWVASALRPAAPEPLTVTTPRLRVEAAGADPDGHRLHLRVLLRTLGTGQSADVVLGPLTPERTTHSAAVPGCADGCRLVGFEILGMAHSGGYRPVVTGSRVDLYRLTGDATSGAALVGPPLLGDAGRWRPAVGEWDRGPVIAARDDRLRLTRPAPTAPSPEGPLLLRDDRVFLVDSPLPLPAVTAGWQPPPADTAQPRLSVLGGPPVPVQPQAPARLLPVLGGRGALVDLEYAHRLDPSGGAQGTAQVWLAPTAGAAVIERLRAAGLEPVRVESPEAYAARLAGDGATAVARMQVAVALVALLLAAAAVLARFTGQRPDQVAELASLRAQGMDDRAARAVRYGVPAVVVGAAVVVGVPAGLAGVALARLGASGFADGWTLLPQPPPHPYPVLLAALVSAAVLGAAVVATVAAGRRWGDQE